MNPHPGVQEVVQEIVKRLAAAYAPQKIILFGSYASGKPGADSDLDLLIIKATPDRFLDRLTQVRRIVAGAHRGIPLDPIVLTPEEVTRRLNRGDQFLAAILREGDVVYAA